MMPQHQDKINNFLGSEPDKTTGRQLLKRDKVQKSAK